MDIDAARLLAAAICMGLGAIGPAIGEGMAASKALEAMGRNPQEANNLFTKMIISMAICESTGIYALLISLIILFAV